VRAQRTTTVLDRTIDVAFSSRCRRTCGPPSWVDDVIAETLPPVVTGLPTVRRASFVRARTGWTVVIHRPRRTSGMCVVTERASRSGQSPELSPVHVGVIDYLVPTVFK
jgi:hypothetical protein